MNTNANNGKSLRRSVRLSQKHKKANVFTLQPTIMMASENLLDEYDIRDTQICLNQMMVDTGEKAKYSQNELNRSPPLDLSTKKKLNLNGNAQSRSAPHSQRRVAKSKMKAVKAKVNNRRFSVGIRNGITKTKILKDLTKNVSKRRGKPRRGTSTSTDGSIQSIRKITRRNGSHRKRHQARKKTKTVKKNYRQSSKRNGYKKNCNYREKLKNFKAKTRKALLPELSDFNSRKNTQTSILPARYPSHFTHQLTLDLTNDANFMKECPQQEESGIICITPDNTPSTSSPSLPNSLRGVFHTNDIHELLNIEKVSYRLYDSHIKALAIVLNIDYNYLRDVLDKIMSISSNILERVDTIWNLQFATGEDCDLFPQITSSSSDMIASSPETNQMRHFPNQKSNK